MLAPSLPAPSRVRWLAHVPALLLVLQILITTALALHGGDTLRYFDEEDYHGIAQRLNAGHGFTDKDLQPSAFRPPGYPVLLAAVYQVVDRPLAAKLLNGVWLLLATLLLMRMAGPAVPSARWSIPLLVLASPLMLYCAGTLYPQVFALFLFVASLWLVLRERVGLVPALLAGALYGALTLTVSSFLLLLPLLLAGLLWVWAGSWAARLLRAGVFVLAMAAVMAPWILRNHAQFGAIVPVSTNGGLNLLLGNSANTRPNAGVSVDFSEINRKAHGLSEVARDALFREHAVAWIKQNPGDAAWLYVRKTLNYFNFRNEIATAGQSVPTADVVLFATYYPMLALLLWRVWMVRRHPLTRREGLLYVLYIGNAFLSAIFFTRLRFRVPFDALLLLMTAYAIDLGLSARAAPRSKGAAAT